MRYWVILIVSFLLLLETDVSATQMHLDVDSLKKVALELKSGEEKIDILLEISDLLKYADSYTALEYAQEALTIAKSNQIISGKAKSLWRISFFLQKNMNYKEALSYANQSLELAEKMGLESVQIEAMLVKGMVLDDLGDYEKSSKYYFDGLLLSEKLDDKRLISKSLLRIGNSYFDQEKYETALEYYENSLKYAKEANYIKGMSINYHKIATVYGRLNQTSKIKPNLLKSISINEQIGDTYYLGFNYSNLGAYYFGEDQIDSTAFYIENALLLAQNDNNHELICHINYTKAYQLFFKENYEQSLLKIRDALSVSQKYNLVRHTYYSFVLLDSLYNKLENYELAYRYQSMASQLEDSLALEDRHTDLSKLELIYDMKKIESDKEAKQQLREQGYLLGLVILLLSISIVLLLLWRAKMKEQISNLENQKLEKNLESKNKELTNNVISLMKKNELLREFSMQLLKIEKQVENIESKSSIRKVSKQLQQSIETEIWEEFTVRFNEVHLEFYKTLMAQYPKLSPNEQRLSAFLRLNMTTKEISELTGQSRKAIEMGRFRLRKKLKITGSDENLITFLSKI